MRQLLNILFVSVAGLWMASAQTVAPSLRGTVTDPSGALVPEAMVQIVGGGAQQRVSTGQDGTYSIPNLRPGKYTIRFIAKGFTVTTRRDVEIRGPVVLDTQLVIEAEAQVINVEDEANRLTADPSSNISAIVLGEKELAELSDDPDELSQQLQALAGPSTGPNGGQIFIDGFSGGSIPPKSSIREVRINSNPFSAEYDRPGFGRIEILTKPGSDKIRGQAFFQFNNQNLNSRNPLLASSTRPPYEQQFLGFSLSGPIKKGKASYGFDIERRLIDENAFILATTLDNSFRPQQVNQAVVTPQRRFNISPRIDYQINQMNTLVARYQETHVTEEKQGVGDFSLLSKAFDTEDRERTLQVTETAILGAKMINETRFQFRNSSLSQFGDNTIPAISVQGAFDGGGAAIGNSSNTVRGYEFNNTSTYTHGTHITKFGGRFRINSLDNISVNNFGGTYVFFGGSGPALNDQNQAIAGTQIALTALERYRRTLLFQQAGLSAAQIRQLGGGASQLSLNGGQAQLGVNQFDMGLFFNDDWRINPRLTLSYGLRYEAQTNMSDYSNFAPRVGLAWAVDGGNGKPSKTVLRLGFGSFFDRLNENATLQARRFDGRTQLSYLITNPDTYPVIPSVASLASNVQPQRLQFIDSTYRAPRNYQMSMSLERQINKFARVSFQFIQSQGSHLQRQRNINAPVNGLFPFGDRQLRILTESTGHSWTRQLVVAPNVNYKRLFLFGFYSLSFGASNAEGNPADPNNLRAEWGPSTFADVRHRLVLGTSLPLPWKISLSPFFTASGGTPYNITIGRDLNGDGFTSERPELLAGRTAANCTGSGLVYTQAFGCFNLSPAPGATTIDRNYGRGPMNATLNFRLSRTWGFGNRAEARDDLGPVGMGGVRGGGGPGGGGPGGGGPPPGMGGGGRMGGGPGGGGPPAGMFGGNSGKKYSLTLSLQARNALNAVNWAAPSGDLSSPFFGQFRSLAGGFGPFGNSSTFNRKLDLQLRFTF